MSLFGNKSSSLFGGNTQSSTTATQNNSNSLFGSTNNTASTGNSLFGNSTNTPTTGSSLFGKSNTNNSSSTNLFGNNTTSSGSSNLFGNNNSNTASGSSLFGTSNNNTSTSNSLFGNKTTNTSSGSSLFGNNTNSSNTNSLFGNNNSNASTNNSLLGNTNTQQQNQSQGLPQELIQQSQQMQQSLLSAKSQLLQTFFPFIFFTGATSLKYTTSSKDSNENTEVNLQKSVDAGRLPSGMRSELLKMHSDIKDTETLLKNISDLSLPEMDAVEFLISSLAEKLSLVSSEVEKNSVVAKRLMKVAKENGKNSEKVLHETRRASNMYNGGVKYMLKRSIPSDYFVNLLKTLSHEMEEIKVSIDSLAEQEKEAKEGGVVEEERNIGVLLRRQYERFLKVAGMVSKTHRSVESMRQIYKKQFGDEFSELEEKEKMERKRMQRQLEQNALSVDVSQIFKKQKSEAKSVSSQS